MPDTHIEIRPRRQFRGFIESMKRWACLIVHRRGGKTYSSLQKLILRALTHKRPGPPKRYAYIAPTRDQAKDIAWGYLKAFTSKIPGTTPNESDLLVKFPCGMTIRLYSGENYERMRGLYFDGVVIDEPEDIDPLAWPRVIRPTLTDYQGWAIWIGTVKGKKGQWARYLAAKDDPEWFTLLLKASDSGILSEDELADIRRDPNMDEDSYQQEYECNPNIGIPGVLFAKFMTDAETGGRIINFEWDRSEPVYTFWDLGSPTNTRCTFVQFVGREIHVIDHDADLNDPELTPAKRVGLMKERGYYFAEHFLPHDAGAREKSGKNFSQQLAEAGLTNIRIIPKCREIWPGVNKLAEILPRCIFNKSKCAYLIESLENYRRKIDADGSVTDRIHEDWACHSTDSMRMLAEAMLNNMLKNPTAVIRETSPSYQPKVKFSRYRDMK
jgi:phage terminase large subunit